MDLMYFYYLFLNIDFKKYHKGSALPTLDLNKLKQRIFPLPPLAEQKRIVEKIEAIFKQADIIEEKRLALKTAVRHTKSRVLDLAVRGKLTEQRPEEGSAEELLERIREEKQRLIAGGKLKKEKPLPEITEDEIPFNIPAGWKWCRLGEICDINPRNDIEKNIDVSFVPMACINPGFSKEFTYEVRQWDSVKSGFTVFADNDVGIAKITPCFENRKSVLFKNLVNGFGAGTTELHILRPIHDILSDTFLFWFVKTESFIKNGIACFSGAVGQQRISRDYVANTLFPLPPLAEQKRIVEKIEQIFDILDTIEKAVEG